MGDPLATPDELQLYLALDQGDFDEARATLVLELAQDKCEAVVNPLPYRAKGIVLDVAGRAYNNPGQVLQQTVGPVSVSYGAAATGGLWLTKANIGDLRRLSGRGQAFTIDTMPATAGSNVPAWGWGYSHGYTDGGWD